MNVKRQHCFCLYLGPTRYAKPKRNDGFLSLFSKFSKSNAFSENLIRTKFILHKIFFRMSILLSNKTLRMFFNLHPKIVLVPSPIDNSRQLYHILLLFFVPTFFLLNMLFERARIIITFFITN